MTIGLAWGWHALTTNAPFTEAAAPAPDLDKVIILLTDGDNTESWNNSNNTKVTSAVGDRRAHRLGLHQHQGGQHQDLHGARHRRECDRCCKSCATNPSMYFDVQNASQLNNVFTAIAQNLANLRIAK